MGELFGKSTLLFLRFLFLRFHYENEHLNSKTVIKIKLRSDHYTSYNQINIEGLKQRLLIDFYESKLKQIILAVPVITEVKGERVMTLSDSRKSEDCYSNWVQIDLLLSEYFVRIRHQPNLSLESFAFT